MRKPHCSVPLLISERKQKNSLAEVSPKSTHHFGFII